MDMERKDLFEQAPVAQWTETLEPKQTEEAPVPQIEDPPIPEQPAELPMTEQAYPRVPYEQQPTSCPGEQEPMYDRPASDYGYDPYETVQQAPYRCDPYETAQQAPYGYPPREPQGNPYDRSYYGRPGYGQSYAPNQQPYYTGNYVPLIREAAHTPMMPYTPYTQPTPIVRKNNKTVTALILGIIAMGVLNFMPFVALILSIVGVCTGYSGLVQGELTKGKRICGYIGLALGIIGLILSVTMLITLLTLSIRAIRAVADSANSIIR